MKTKEIDLAKLSEALEKFGSLQKANAQLEKDKLTLGKGNAQLNKENKKLAVTGDKLASQIDDINAKITSGQNKLQALANNIEVYSYQYKLFCGFMAMVTESPSVTDAIDTLIDSFQKLKEPVWYLPKNADEMRSLFIRTVLGDYLKCFRCDSCGAKFIANSKPKHKLFGNGYQCPVCHNWYAVKEDDSFIKALVSEQQLENTQQLEKVLEEYEKIEPFGTFLNIPCGICHEPVKEWDDYNVKLAIEGTGCGHISCWGSELGQLRQLFKVLDKEQKEKKSKLKAFMHHSHHITF
jgi:predicted RNA-binding Zn-ribbon protein involved in translation (DUF1610 family)